MSELTPTSPEVGIETPQEKIARLEAEVARLKAQQQESIPAAEVENVVKDKDGNVLDYEAVFQSTEQIVKEVSPRFSIERGEETQYRGSGTTKEIIFLMDGKVVAGCQICIATDVFTNEVKMGQITITRDELVPFLSEILKKANDKTNSQ